jgi:CRP-like cAMP-binding protein
MSEQLFDHINKFIAISAEEFKMIHPFFDLCTFNKKDIIVAAGTKCDKHIFILKGCVHMYFLSEKGMEKTVQFALKNWWMTDNLAFHNQAATEFSIQAVERTQVLSITYENQEMLLSQFPQLEKYFRILYQIAYGASLIRTKLLFDLSKEDLYFQFTRDFPEFAQTVPQYLIASFLGLTPEYVSEIRNKKRS